MSSNYQSSNSAEKSDQDAIDQELLIRAGQGDQEAFEDLVRRYQGVVVGTITKMLGDCIESEDLSQQVFVSLWKSAKTYKPQAKFTTFLFTIVRNLVFSESRKRTVRSVMSSLEDQGSEGEFRARSQQEPDQLALQAELSRMVDRAIEELPKKQSLALILRRYEGLSYEEIAEVMDVRVSAVKSQLFRARTTLKKKLAKYLE